MVSTATDAPTFKYKLQQGLSPDSSLESISLANCSFPPGGYPTYPEATTTSYPPDSFGMLDQTNVVYTSEQPIEFETMSTGIRQKMAGDARLRYSGHMPGHVNGRSGSEESERISQWSQWLKGAAPPPVF